MGVQKPQLFSRLQKGLVGMLAVDVDEFLPERPHLAYRGRRAIDPGSGAAARIKHAAHQNFIVIRLKAVIREPAPC